MDDPTFAAELAAFCRQLQNSIRDRTESNHWRPKPMDDLPARLRQGVVRVFPAGYSKSLSMGVVDHCATEAMMRDAADEIERLRKIEEAKTDG